ncbi:MAG: MASE4 domain-containing protein [Alphaproteobacteria bacterium]|nr:MASE4 domain-containing protein [Alphaproteobacteria bacterium]
MDRSDTFLATAPAPPDAKRWALAICIALFVAFCGLVAFANVSMPHIQAFIPIYDSIFALNNLLTAGGLLVGFSRSRLLAVLVLASGYLFTSLLALPHVLTSSGLLSTSGFLSADAETSAWVETFRHGGFPLFVIAYASLKPGETIGARSRAATRANVRLAATGATAGACLVFLLATAGQQLVPRLMDRSAHTTAMLVANVPIVLLSVAALAVLASWRPYSRLDVWLMVVVLAWIFDVVLGTIISKGPFDLGFYAGHLYGLFAASVVPIVVLVEASRLYGGLEQALTVAEERNTELARSREELAQAQRLEAIGQLTGGVAHDFNNLLTIVIGNLELILGARGDRDKIERLAQNAIKAAQRGEHLVQQLLTYARRQISHPQTVNINRRIVNVESLMHRLIGEQIEIVTRLSPFLAPVEIDPAQFETAILNLAINSRDAMTAGGRITIETRNVIFDKQRAAAVNPELTPGPYVMIAVSDTGTGMTSAVLARAFDPFFTTKEIGKGSGLGLSQVYGFVKTAGGHVEINSELGVGTTVRLYLPQSSKPAILPKAGAEAAPSQPASGRGTILIVEDDADVLAVTAESLRDLGYRVITAVNATGALEILRSRQPVDLLFSDVIIPGGTDGVQLAAEARRIRPELKVLLTSGYTAAALSQEHGLPDTLEVVGKPYQREELAKKLRLAIGG